MARGSGPGGPVPAGVGVGCVWVVLVWLGQCILGGGGPGGAMPAGIGCGLCTRRSVY